MNDENMIARTLFCCTNSETRIFEHQYLFDFEGNFCLIFETAQAGITRRFPFSNNMPQLTCKSPACMLNIHDLYTSNL